MKFAFNVRGQETVFAPIEDVVAVRAEPELADRETRAESLRRFGERPQDDSRGGSAGLVLPARNRRVLEKAGWLLVSPHREVAAAAVTRSRVEGAQSVRRVYLMRGGAVIGTDRLAVKCAPDATEAQINEWFNEDGLAHVRTLRFSNQAYEVRIRDERPELEVVQELQQKTNRYVYAEPIWLEPLAGRQMPDDPAFSDCWFHENLGSNGGVAGADIKSLDAWAVTRGDGVRIAVIDNGMHVNHPDINDGIAGGGYFVDDGLGSATLRSWSVGQHGFPGGRHGTACLGMAGARMNNGRGGCGAAPEARLLAIACMPDQVGSQTTLARAVAYAADPTTEDSQASPDDGADIIACSLGPNGADWVMTSPLEEAINAAATGARRGLGAPIFWACTNGNFDIAADEVCSHPRVMAIARSNRNDLEDGAGYGPELEFVAPGVDVYAPSTSRGYEFVTGCSFAAPLAAGVGALALAIHPDWSASQLRQHLRQSCDQIGGVRYTNGRHNFYGSGRINASLAVQ